MVVDRLRLYHYFCGLAMTRPGMRSGSGQPGPIFLPRGGFPLATLFLSLPGA